MNETMTELKAHPAADLFPMWSAEALQGLADNIRDNGLYHAIEIFDGQILDGRNRYAACKLAGVEPRVTEARFSGSPTLYVVSNNLQRRSMTPAQKACIGAEMMPILQAEAKARQAENGRKVGTHNLKNQRGSQNWIDLSSSDESTLGRARELAGRAVGVSGALIEEAGIVREKSPELYERLKRGDGLTVWAAYKLVKTVKPTPEPEPQKRKGKPVTPPTEKTHERASQSMMDALSRVSGYAYALTEQGVKVVTPALTRAEAKTWAKTARTAARRLFLYARQLENTDANEYRSDENHNTASRRQQDNQDRSAQAEDSPYCAA